jgi:hypothetical protein
MFKPFFLDGIEKFRSKNWYLELESCSKTLEYRYSSDIKDGIFYIKLEYRDESIVRPYLVILIEFKKWLEEESDYEDYPSYVEIVKVNADMHDFEGMAKEFLALRRKVSKIVSEGRITFAELMKKLEEEGVEFGI